MFVERNPENSPAADPWFDQVSRRRPALFTGLLAVLAVLVVLGLLYKPGATVVLYQGF
jgi:hypothetical protein